MVEMNKVSESQQMTVNERGGWEYPSSAASGHCEIVLPTLPGSPNGEERMLAKDFGVHVATQTERAMKQQPYLRSGPTQSAPQVLSHYAAVARGSGLLDAGASRRMSDLATEFENEADREEFFSMVVRPYLHSLTPKRR